MRRETSWKEKSAAGSSLTCSCGFVRLAAKWKEIGRTVKFERFGQIFPNLRLSWKPYACGSQDSQRDGSRFFHTTHAGKACLHHATVARTGNAAAAMERHAASCGRGSADGGIPLVSCPDAAFHPCQSPGNRRGEPVVPSQGTQSGAARGACAGRHGRTQPGANRIPCRPR